MRLSRMFPLLIVGIFATFIGDLSIVAADEPPVPRALESYRGRIEYNNVGKNFTVEIEDTYSKTLNMAKMRHSKMAMTHDFYINYNTREAMIVNETGNCEAKNNISFTHDRMLNLIIGGDYMFSIKTLLELPVLPHTNKTYIGTTMKRNIYVDGWQFYVKNPHSLLSFTYYYTRAPPSWITASGRPQLPVLLEMRMEMNNTKNTLDINFLHLETNFDSDKQDDFLTPIGLYCANRALNITGMPKITDYVSYGVESLLYDPITENIYNAKVKYDKKLKLVSYDHHVSIGDPQPPFYALGSLKVIHDFNSGVAYHIDQMFGNCSARPIGVDLFDQPVSVKRPTARKRPVADSPGKSPLEFAEMRSPGNLFRIDGNYSYVGKRTVRGIPVNHYTSLRTDYQIDRILPGTKTIFDLFFLDDSIGDAQADKGIGFLSQVPISMTISLLENNPAEFYREVHNFFNFDTTEASIIGTTPAWKYDVTPCYDDMAQKRIRLVFNGPSFELFVANETALFYRDATIQFHTVVGTMMSPLRLQRLELGYNSTNIFLTLTILSAPPLDAQFIRVKGKSMPTPQKSNATLVASERDCLMACNAEVTFICLSVTYDSKSGRCQLSPKQYSFVQLVNASSTFVYFAKSVPDVTRELSLEDIMSILKSAVDSQSFTVTLEQANGLSPRVFTAAEVIDNIYRQSEDVTVWPTIGPYMLQFTEIKNTEIHSTNPIDGQVLANDCARLCLDDPSTEPCQSFSYDFKQGQCFLSMYTPQENPRMVTHSSDRNLYTKDPLTRYLKFSGEIIRRSNSYQGIKMNTPEECATKCTNNGKGDCRSFDFCRKSEEPEVNICYQNTAHVTDSSHPKTEDKNCDHYSRGFVSDFRPIGTHKDISISNFVVYEDQSDHSCARICVDYFGTSCQGYFSCIEGETKTCAVVMNDQTDQVKTKGSHTCVYSQRLVFLDGSPYEKNLKIRTQGLNPGGAIGLALGMLILGALIAALVCIFLVPKFRSTSSPNDTRIYFHGNEGGQSSVQSG